MRQGNRFDLIAIGGGSGGLAVAEKAAALGARVAIADPAPLGGTCVRAGCVPKKIMWYAADMAHHVRHATDLGFDIELGDTDWGHLVQARERHIDTIHSYWGGYAARLGIEHLQGRAKLLDAHTLDVNGKRYEADHVVIASGSRPVVPNLPGAELGATSEEFFRFARRPDKVAVIGAGYVGVELAGVLRALGADVSILAQADRPLELFDDMISRSVEEELQRQGIELHLSQRVAALQETARGLSVITAHGRAFEGFDQIIWAVGRRPNVDGLGLDAAGVRAAANGAIITDPYQNTGVEGVYAIGDVTGRVPLTPVAIAAGRRLAERLFDDRPDRHLDYDNIPSVVFTHPPAATVGLTEAEACQRHGGDIAVYETEFTPMRYALSTDAPKTRMKLVCAGADERLVGVHLVGDGVDEMLQGFAVALNMGARKRDLDETVAIHPVSAEELVTLRQSRHACGVLPQVA